MDRFWQRLRPREDAIADWVERGWEFLADLVLSVAILIAFWIAASIFRRFIQRVGTRAHVNPDVLVLLASTGRLSVLAIGLVMACGPLGVNVTALVAGLGLTGFAVGFAVKDILSNWLAGVLILIYEPFRRNDVIRIDELEGKVVAIDFRYTTLQSEGQLILVPNNNLFTKEIIVKRPSQ